MRTSIYQLACAASLWLTLATSSAAAQGQPRTKPVIRSADELPKFVYRTTAQPGELASQQTGFPEFSTTLISYMADITSRFDLRDKATLSHLHQTSAQLEALNGRTQRAEQEAETATSFMNKADERRMFSIVFAADLKAVELTRGRAVPQTGAYQSFLEQLFRDKTWNEAGEAALSLTGQCIRFSPAYAEAVVDNDVGVEAARTVPNFEVAAEIVTLRLILNRLPLCNAIEEVVGSWLKAHRSDAPEPFRDRVWTLAASEHGSPTVVAVWDTGFDRKQFSSRLTLPSDAPTPGMDWNGEPTRGDLPALTLEDLSKMPESLRLLRGLGDSFEGIGSSDATFYREAIRGLETVEEARDLDRRVWRIAGTYAHGTAVADLALEGNPFAKLLPIRMQFPNQSFVPTLEGAKHAAEQFFALVAYCRTNHVRVVNVSWGIEFGELEDRLQSQQKLNAEQRHELAKRIFAAYRDGMEKATRSAPEILFVAASGNSGADPAFSLNVPQCLWKQPNVLVVGALNRAALPSSMSNFGPSVRLYALGEGVKSLLPGGTRAFMEGTSLAAPAVTNLAGKLLALKPSLTPAQLIDLMIRGSVPSREGGFPGLNPGASRNLLIVQSSALALH